MNKYEIIAKHIQKMINYYNNWRRGDELLFKLTKEHEFATYNFGVRNFPEDHPLYEHRFKVGQVLKFHFGANIPPEMSFIHMGIIISINDSYLYVLPIMSYKEEYSNAYHPQDNNEEYDRNYYLLKEDEFPFIQHDSILKVTDLRCISKRKATEYCNYQIDNNSLFFKEITKMCTSVVFPDVLFENEKKVSVLNMKLYLSKVKKQYTISDISEIDINKLNIPDEFKLVSFDKIENIDNTYKYLLGIKDKYNQVEEKGIVYVLKRTE